MNRTLIPHPRFSLATPVITAREMALAAICAGLKSQLNQRYMQLRAQAEQIGNLAGLVVMMGEHAAAQAAKITALEERNRQLTKALHRSACAGHALPQVVYFGALLTACGFVHARGGAPGILALGAGFLFGVACVLCVLHTARPRRTTARRRVHPAHLDEPGVDVPRAHTAPLGEAYADESEFEPFERAIHHPEAQAARARFEATAAALR